MFLLSLANTECEANPNNNPTMRRAGLSSNGRKCQRVVVSGHIFVVVVVDIFWQACLAMAGSASGSLCPASP